MGGGLLWCLSELAGFYHHVERLFDHAGASLELVKIIGIRLVRVTWRLYFEYVSWSLAA